MVSCGGFQTGVSTARNALKRNGDFCLIVYLQIDPDGQEVV